MMKGGRCTKLLASNAAGASCSVGRSLECNAFCCWVGDGGRQRPADTVLTVLAACSKSLWGLCFYGVRHP